jgi:ketosteroid isomerase-like protein
MTNAIPNDIAVFLTHWTSAERSGDTAVLDSLLTDDFAGVGPLGFVLPKAAWVGRHQSGDLVYETFDVDEVATHPHGDFVLVVARHVAKGAYQGHPIPEAARASLALVRDVDAWRLAGLHLSFIAGTPGAPPIPGPPNPR